MKNQTGLSLVELMISITLGLILMTGVLKMFSASKNVYGSQKSISRIQETGRLAMDFIGKDLRMSGHLGYLSVIDNSVTQASAGGGSASSAASSNSSACVEKYKVVDTISANAVSCTATSATSTLSGLHTNFRVGIRGYTEGASGTGALPHGTSTDLGGSLTVKPGSDILSIHTTNERGVPIKQANTATQVFGYTDQSIANSCIEGFCVNGIAVIADSKKGRLFQVSAISLSGNVLSLTHGDTWDMTDDKNNFSPLGIAKSDAIILPVHTLTYFIAVSTATGASPEYALWQKTDSDPPQELLRGVENMFIQYSEDGNTYKSASNVTDWDALASVKIQLLAKGSELNTLENSQPYTFANTTTTPNDKIMRQVFISTFALRNRIHNRME